jgi:hypothetical protein
MASTTHDVDDVSQLALGTRCRSKRFDLALSRILRGCLPRRSVHPLRPGPVPRQQRQQRNTDHTDDDLHPDRIRYLYQHEVACEGQEGSDAEDFQRLLSAENGGPENAPFETGPIARHQPDDKKCDDDKVEETIRGKVGLVVGIKDADEPGRKYLRDIRMPAGHGHPRRRCQANGLKYHVPVG